MTYSTKINCRVSNNKMKILKDFGNLHISQFKDSIEELTPTAPLRMGFNEQSYLFQLADTVDRDLMYRQYWYRSGTNLTMTNQLIDIINTIPVWKKLKENDIILDIGSNDGTLLKNIKSENKIIKVGIDPAKNLKEICEEVCDFHLCDYFTDNKFKDLVNGRKANVITSIAMFYDLDDPNTFVKDIYNSLADDGIWILQLSYTPLMFIQNAFDNIMHEHIEYYSLLSVEKLLNQNEFIVRDIELNNTNGGSCKIIVSKKKSVLDRVNIFDVDIGKYRVDSMRNFEIKMHLNSEKSFNEFLDRIEKLKTKTLELLYKVKKEGKTIIGYGASSKGNTLLQYYGIDNKLIEAIAERQPTKFGKFTPGTNIPIISEKEMRKINPDYLFVLPWHFISEFKEREKNFLASGGKLIVPLPELKIIGN